MKHRWPTPTTLLIATTLASSLTIAACSTNPPPNPTTPTATSPSANPTPSETFTINPAAGTLTICPPDKDTETKVRLYPQGETRSQYGSNLQPGETVTYQLPTGNYTVEIDGKKATTAKVSENSEQTWGC